MDRYETTSEELINEDQFEFPKLDIPNENNTFGKLYCFYKQATFLKIVLRMLSVLSLVSLA